MAVRVQNPIGGDRGAKIGDDDRPEVGMRLYFILLLGLLRRVLRSRDDLLMENLVLRQQLAVYARRPKRPRLQDADRLFWSAVARTWEPWRSHLQLVRPETVIGWHRTAWRRYWTWRESPQASKGDPASIPNCAC